MKQSIWGVTPAELEDIVATVGAEPYRARQILAWLYQRNAASFDEMTDLPAGLRSVLDNRLDLSLPPVLTLQEADDGLTRKLLLQLPDGETVETVLMQYPEAPGSRERATVCVSTQVGCAMGCVFCATGQAGFVRNLPADQVVAQVMSFVRDVHRPTNVVFMGMGEPLANYASMWKAVEILNDGRCLGLGARHITVSTVGLVPGIRRLAREKLQVNLAVSLHAPNDALRRQLIPTTGQPIAELLAACREFFEASGRRVTFEYVLIDGVNDSRDLARELTQILRGFPCHVNLIPVNPTPDASIRR
ncbi:MAG: 23S rRNA (adenine(2503)-C(2))-methyltransferase RlmN, partial [Dehalococcoidia bacterium]|nr:23S rRNA (adenine(2503)-C(2))-methyltransferase RlmN [Dehalococcoidia bacterium]